METSGDIDQARREWLVVLALTVVAAIPRLWGLGSEGLTHFDEGVYAFAGLWSVNPREADGIGAMVVPYAPPGFPFLVGLAYSVLGVSDTSILLVSAACGVLTVPVAAWVGRRTFGPGAGASTAAFAALSMAHIAFSRKGLTDAPFLLTWLIAIGMGGRFLERPGLSRAIVLGLAVGLAQNVKYNGGVAGLIVAVAAGLGALTSREARTSRSLFKTFGYGLIASAVSGATYWPWFQFVESHGGYAGLVKHQQGYVGGWHLWWPYWRQQLAQLISLSGGWGWLAFTTLVAAIGSGLAQGGMTRLLGPSTRVSTLRRVLVLTSLVLLSGVRDGGWWVGIFMVVPLAREGDSGRRLLAAWWLVMTLITPIYHPYARLWMPLHAAGWVMLGGIISQVAHRRGDVDLFPEWWARLPVHRRQFVLIPACLCLLFALGQWGRTPPGSFSTASFFAPTDSIRKCAGDIRALVVTRDSPPPPLQIHGRRPIAFYLATLGIPFRLAEGPSSAEERSWQVSDSAVRELKPRDGPGLIRRWTSPLDPVTRLDVDPGAVLHSQTQTDAEIGLFHPP